MLRQHGSDMTLQEQAESLEAIGKFTDIYNEAIRDASRPNSPYQKEYSEYVDRIENYIYKSPKFSSPIYRGIVVSEQEKQAIVETLKSGQRIDMQGLSSWSSKKDIAEFYAHSGESLSGYSSIVFVSSKGTKAGTSIQFMSAYGKEDSEVLVSRHTTYSSSKIITKNKVTYIYVNEHIKRRK